MKNYPIIIFVILLILGILSNKIIQVELLLTGMLFVITLLIFIISKKIKIFEQISLVLNLLLFVLIICLGNFLAGVYYQGPNQFFKNIRSEKDVTVFGKIEDINLIRTGRLDFYIITDSITSPTLNTKQKVKLICRLFDEQTKVEELYNSIQPGNKVSVKGYFSKGRERRNPGEFDYNKYLESQNITGLLSLSSSSDLKIISDDTNIISTLLFNTRKEINKRIYDLHNVQSASLLRGLLLADRYEINYDLNTQFINAGVVHVLSVSGLHVGFIVLIFIIIFGRFNIILRSGLTITGLFFFMVLTGASAPVFRATVMVLVFILAYISNRNTNVFNSIAISALIILLIDPYEIYSAGFQLSYSAVIAMAIIYPILNEWIEQYDLKRKFLKQFLLFIAISLSAQIGTIPLTLIYFGKISLIAIIANIVVIPITGVNIALGFATIIISYLSSTVASLFAATNDLLIDWLYKLIWFGGKFQYSHLLVSQYTIYDAIVFTIFLIGCIYFISRFKSSVSKLVLIILITLNIFLYSSLNNEELLPENKFSIVMIDIGQGDSFLLKFPNGETALIDAGNVTPNFDNGERIILPLLNYLGIDKIDYGFISHIDMDHYGGFVSLIYNNKINKIFTPLIDTSSAKELRFQNYLKQKNILVEYYNQQNMEFGQLKFYILNHKDDVARQNLSSNNKSGLLKIVYGNTSFLFTGDMEKQAERYYAGKYKEFLDTDLLKVSHHGSTTSSTEIFINLASPEIGLISAGFKNKFGHPKQEVIDRLTSRKTELFRTDLDRAVIVRSDGQDIQIIDWN
jgi:competence protein ComEC